MAEIFITQRIPGRCFDQLKENGHTIRIHTGDNILSTYEIMQEIGRAEVLLCTLANQITTEVMDSAPRLRMIANYAVGYNNIDIAGATERGLLVTNTPGALTEATADLAWALLLATARRIPEGDVMCRNGKFSGWLPELLLGKELHGKTIGIVGAGRIGSAVARRASGFGMNILYHSREPKFILEERYSARQSSIREIFETCDYISIHLPGTPETKGMIDSTLLNSVKDGAILINTGRGQVVDEKGLCEVLKSRKLWGAGLDVYENEPQIFEGLLKLSNVVLAPHVGSATDETRAGMGELAASNIIAYMNGDNPPTPVNPEILEV